MFSFRNVVSEGIFLIPFRPNSSMVSVQTEQTEIWPCVRFWPPSQP
uniref:Uncharacterized protein n=1 Tax=Anguilla anguilla TaxID=7936 RepID=A0A0E9T048_ANGAN